MAFFDLPSEPLVVIDRADQQVQRDLIDSASGFRGEAIQFGFKFWRNLQVHEASLGSSEETVNHEWRKNLIRPEASTARQGHWARLLLSFSIDTTVTSR